MVGWFPDFRVQVDKHERHDQLRILLLHDVILPMSADYREVASLRGAAVDCVSSAEGRNERSLNFRRSGDLDLHLAFRAEAPSSEDGAVGCWHSALYPVGLEAGQRGHDERLECSRDGADTEDVLCEEGSWETTPEVGLTSEKTDTGHSPIDVDKLPVPASMATIGPQVLSRRL